MESQSVSKPARKHRLLVVTSVGLAAGILFCAAAALITFPELRSSFIGRRVQAALCTKCGGQFRLQVFVVGENKTKHQTSDLRPGQPLIYHGEHIHNFRPIGHQSFGFVPGGFQLVRSQGGHFNGDEFYYTTPLWSALQEIAKTNAQEAEVALEWIHRMRFSGRTTRLPSLQITNVILFKEQLDAAIKRDYPALPVFRLPLPRSGRPNQP